MCTDAVKDLSVGTTNGSDLKTDIWSTIHEGRNSMLD